MQSFEIVATMIGAGSPLAIDVVDKLNNLPRGPQDDALVWWNHDIYGDRRTEVFFFPRAETPEEAVSWVAIQIDEVFPMVPRTIRSVFAYDVATKISQF